MQNALHQALFVCTFEVLYVGASIARPQILLRKIYRRKAKSVHYPFKIRNSLNFGGRAMLAPTDTIGCVCVLRQTLFLAKWGRIW
jgi:hypothetical protein